MPQDYIDTQGLSPKLSDEERAQLKKTPQKHKPMVVTPRRLFSPEYVREMKILINEVLDEREGKFNYTSYFDAEKFKHPIDEEEPRYK
tara:strand:- start:5 stop:268 length:264 start_codon:yes stop_codon:yes gene_type:complete